MGTMFGWSRAAVAVASRRKRLRGRFRGEVAGEDDFQRDQAQQRNLSGAIDDAHAAAGNHLEEFVIADLPRLERLSAAGGSRGRVTCTFGINRRRLPGGPFGINRRRLLIGRGFRIGGRPSILIVFRVHGRSS